MSTPFNPGWAAQQAARQAGFQAMQAQQRAMQQVNQQQLLNAQLAASRVAAQRRTSSGNGGASWGVGLLFFVIVLVAIALL